MGAARPHADVPFFVSALAMVNRRDDFIGVLKDEYLPDWAKERLKQYQRSENEETQEMQMGGM